ncbi:MAG: hypothetical protein LBU34_14145 [Planctomycetaceae bacterium]|jgi:hypothetical protein|nr:hypothetical protein [Planctomycetaceae bacterium]
MNPFFSFRHQTRNQARKHLKFHFPWAFFVFNLGLCLFLFWSILFGDQQTCFRDESHFHYPLFRYIQTELSAGRFPLWTPYDNIGQPFFANASIGILYPGRLIFFLPFDFALLYSWYIAGHVFLATLTIYHLMRSWRISLWGATLGALSYGFCGTVFGQYCNPTFLVGAAWVPEAILWADRTMTRCSFRNALICAAFLSVILLVGDPQGAFHVGLAASLLALFRWRRERVLLKTNGAVLDNVSLPPSSSPIFSLRSLAGLVRNRIVLLGIIAGTTFLFSAVQILSSGEYARLCDRTGYKNPRSVWEIPAFLLADEKNLVKDEILFDDTAVSTRQSADVSRLTRRQRIFNGIFQRGFLDAHQVNSYNFSTHPLNFVAFIWSNITGRNFPQNTAWFGTVFRYIKSPDWHFTLYAGIVPFLLAVLMLRFRLRPVQNIRIIWFSWLFVIALLGGIGYYGLGWMLTFCFGIPSEQNPVTAPVGGVYWLMQVLIPGYIQFRYAPKLLTFAACPMAVLAGYGFDLLLLNFVQKATNSDSIKLDCFRLLKYFKRFAVVIIFISILLLLPASMQSEWNNLATKIPSGEFNGTFKADLAQKQVIGSLIQTISVLFSVLLLLRYRTYISATVFSVILLGIVAADLYISCSPTLFVMDRSFYYENHPEFLKRIERPDDFMPIRIHQNIKPPPRWRWESSPNRETEFRIYERRLMQMQHHYDAPRNHFGNLPIAKAIEPGTTSPYSYTAWVRKNIRNDYRFENNLMFIGVEYVLMDVSRPLDPNLADMLVHPDQAGISTDWSENTVLWRLKNPRQRTWIERENAKEENEGENHDTKNYNKETQKAEHEFSRIIHYEPNHLIIEAKLLESGTVVLSDQFWPGWKLWIETLSDDGREVISSVSGNIRPVEGIFRGVDLSAGHFRLIYRYVPDSFWRGAILSGISWLAFLMLLLIGFFVPQKKKYSVLK